jgi:hypothetical protein
LGGVELGAVAARGTRSIEIGRGGGSVGVRGSEATKKAKIAA